MKKILHSEQKGRSMIEALGYISVMIMITVSVAAAVNSGYYKFRLGRINQQLTDLKKVISQRWVAAENYEDVKFETLVEEGILPSSLKDGNKKDVGIHAFTGTVKIGSENDGDAFSITFEGLPPDACHELGSRLWIVNDGSDLDKIDINGKTWCWKYSTSSGCNYELPAKLNDVSTACEKSWRNKIIWYFE